MLRPVSLMVMQMELAEEYPATESGLGAAIPNVSCVLSIFSLFQVEIMAHFLLFYSLRRLHISWYARWSIWKHTP